MDEILLILRLGELCDSSSVNKIDSYCDVIRDCLSAAVDVIIVYVGNLNMS